RPTGAGRSTGATGSTTLRRGPSRRLRGGSMRRTLGSAGLAGLGLLGVLGGRADAAPTMRYQIDQHGDFVMIGNTLGYDCGNGTPAPIVGAVGACGGSTG